MNLLSKIHPIRLGVIGSSEGNGHPYSWSAIFNGYDYVEMLACPFPVIPQYLSNQKFPDDFLELANVTHIWTQDLSLSKDIAKCSLIPNIVHNKLDLINNVDAILLARDDSKNHLKNSLEFIKLGIPIFIDKPFALKVDTAKLIYNNCKNTDLVYTSSSLSFSPSLIEFSNFLKKHGKIKSINAKIKGKWDTYSMHLIEPILKHFIDWDQEFKVIDKFSSNSITKLSLRSSENTDLNLITDLEFNSKPVFEFLIDDSVFIYSFTDSFLSFRNTLENFVNIIKGKRKPLNPNFVIKTVSLLESGT